MSAVPSHLRLKHLLDIGRPSRKKSADRREHRPSLGSPAPNDRFDIISDYDVRSESSAKSPADKAAY
jgi:hypothetical protein